MSELHRFLFEGLPVRGALVHLSDAWRELLSRRPAGSTPEPLRALLGEMCAAAVLMQSSIRFEGALVLQIQGDGPVRLAVVEVQSDYALRATAKLSGVLPFEAGLSQMVNAGGGGRCAITLDPQNRQPGQQPYQGVAALTGPQGEPLGTLAEVLQHYMAQSEQLDTTLVLAADAEVAAGLLIQRLPTQGEANLAGRSVSPQDAADLHEAYRRIALLASSLKPEELLGLDARSILHRLFWNEPLRRFEPQVGAQGPRFACRCSRERVGRMLQGLGRAQAESVLQERGAVEVACDFCGQAYVFDAVDVDQLFCSGTTGAPPAGLH